MALVSLLSPEEVTPEVTRQLLAVGYNAWSDGFKRTRRPDEIRHTFNPNEVENTRSQHGRDRHIRRAQHQYSEFAARGILAVARDALDDPVNRPIVGYAMAREDVSGNVVARTAKRLTRPDKVYAWLAQVNVLPQYQQKFIGTDLVAIALGEDFKPEQIPTTYIFTENEVVWNAAVKLGFALSPIDQGPTVTHEYFGEDNAPVHQYRLAAPSVEHVIDQIRAKS